MFQNAKIYEIGLLDFYGLFVSIMKLSYEKKRPPCIIKYRDYRKVSNKYFKNSVNGNIADNTELEFKSFQELFFNLLSFQASL